MNKSMLIFQLEKKGFDYPTAKEIVNIFFDDMAQALIKGDRVEIRGFGSFKVKTCKGAHLEKVGSTFNLQYWCNCKIFQHIPTPRFKVRTKH